MGVISPWNYPIQRAGTGGNRALAAGNRVMLKPSLTPLAPQPRWAFDACTMRPEFCVIGAMRRWQPDYRPCRFDHLFFTGSTALDRKVCGRRGSLTPTTLELGGKVACRNFQLTGRRRAPRSPAQTAQRRADLQRPTMCCCRATGAEFRKRHTPRPWRGCSAGAGQRRLYASVLKRHLAQLRCPLVDKDPLAGGADGGRSGRLALHRPRT